MARQPIPTWCFAVVVVRRDDKFLLVQERRHGQAWYLPAGRVEPGESFQAAACRETLEESGIAVRLLGIIRVEYAPSSTGARMRVVFLAEPLDDTPPKSVPDGESLGAAWVTVDELARYHLRGTQVPAILAYVAAGGAVHPLALLQTEGQPYVAAGEPGPLIGPEFI